MVDKRLQLVSVRTINL